MEQVLLVIQVLLAVALIGMVLIQRSESDGFGLSGGSGNNLLTGRGVANLMTRTTAIIAALFMANSLALSVIAARGHTTSLTEQIERDQSGKVMPAVPLEGNDGAKTSSKKMNANDVKPEAATKEEAPAVPVAGDESGPEKRAEEKVSAPVNAAEKAVGVKTLRKPSDAVPSEPAPSNETDHNE